MNRKNIQMHKKTFPNYNLSLHHSLSYTLNENITFDHETIKSILQNSINLVPGVLNYLCQVNK